MPFSIAPVQVGAVVVGAGLAVFQADLRWRGRRRSGGHGNTATGVGAAEAGLGGGAAGCAGDRAPITPGSPRPGNCYLEAPVGRTCCRCKLEVRDTQVKHAGKSVFYPPVENLPFAPIEALDPEWPAHANNGRNQGVLGLLLLFSIALLSLWQFWTENQRHGAYQQGVRAAAVQDWPAAREDYQAAAGYADADLRATAAGLLAAELQGLARQAAAAERRCDGPGLAAVVRRLREIAPQASTTQRFGRDLATVPYWPTWCHE